MNQELLSIRSSGDHQAQTKKVVHRSLQRNPGSPNLATKQLGDIFID